MTTDNDTFEHQGDLAQAMSDPRYATSERYRAEVSAKLQRSREAGTIQQTGSFVQHGEGSTIHTRNAFNAPEGIYGGAQRMPGADPVWAEAGKVGGGFFDGPEAIARAMAAPHFEHDQSYRQAVQAKIDRSIREGWIGTDFNALDPSKRFSR